MKMAYVFQQDAANPTVQSGRPASLLREFEALGVGVERIFPLAAAPSGAELAKKAGYRLLGKHHRNDRHPAFLAALAGEFEARARDRDFDFVFSPGSEAVSLLQTGRPVAFCADATFANLVDYYWDFTGLSAEYLRLGHAQEAAALARATLAVYPSEWAARSAVRDHGADPARVLVIPFGANHGCDNRRPEVDEWIERRPADCIRLLFVGRHWERKGGDIVVAAAQCLIAFGHPVVLDIVGVDVPEPYRDLPWVRAHGLLSPGRAPDCARLEQLMREAHFMFVPSRAEAFGFIYAEANAFGVPAIATRTGGIPAAIRSGHNGVLLPPDAPAADYAEAIVGLFNDRARYRAMCHRAFDEFEHRLNWRVFCRHFATAMEERLAPARAAETASRVA